MQLRPQKRNFLKHFDFDCKIDTVPLIVKKIVNLYKKKMQDKNILDGSNYCLLTQSPYV